MRQGVQDYLVEPLNDGEVLTRVEAAARTKELREELVAQGARLEALLREDALTGLSNRRAILTQLAGMVSAARRHGHPLSIAILDLDHFKRINDTHGHSTGDKVLVAAAHAHGHAPARGGPARPPRRRGVPRPAARYRRRGRGPRRREAAHGGRRRAHPVPVTVSIGVATWDGEAPEDLLHRADEALYAAKEAGRDRVLAATLHGRT